MKQAHRFATVLLAGVLAAGCVWWVLHVPYQPQRLFRAVPAQATFVSRHKELGQRWDQVYANPLIVSLFMTAGVKPSVLREWADDPEIRRWFDRLAGRDAVVAYLPPRYSHGDPTWIVASWLGGGSQRLRWQLSWQKPKEFIRREAHHGHVFWRVMTQDIEPGMVLTVALVEGMLIGCLSDSEERMIEVLDTWDGLYPSLEGRAKHSSFMPAHMSTGVWDAVWMESAGFTGWKRGKHPVGLEFYEITRTSLACRAYALGAQAPRADSTGDWPALARLLGEAPIAIASFPLPWLIRMSGEDIGVWQGVLLRLANDQESQIAVLALLGNDFAGRLAGIRVPAAVVAIPLAHPDQAAQQLREELDFVNARSRWGLIPYPWQRVGETEIVVIEGTGQNLYASLPPDEKPAYAVSGSWLLCASQAHVLRRLLSPQGDSSATPCWRKAVPDAAPFWVWGDFALGQDALRLAFSAYAFKLMLENKGADSSRRERLNEWKAWLDAFEPLQQCAVRAEPWSAGGLMLDVRMGKYCP